MDLSTHVDIDAVLRAVAARLEAPEWKGRDNRRWVVGRLRGRQVTVVCWHKDTGTGGSGWKVTADTDAVPLLLTANRKRTGDNAVIERGAILALVTDDPPFDAEWVVEAAPASTAKRIVDLSLRAALLELGRVLHPPTVAPMFRKLLAPPVTVDRGTVVVTCDGKFDESAVGAGLEVAVLVVERIATLGEARREAPPSAAALAAEEAAIASLRKRDEALWARSPWPVKVALVITAALVIVWMAVASAR